MEDCKVKICMDYEEYSQSRTFRKTLLKEEVDRLSEPNVVDSFSKAVFLRHDSVIVHMNSQQWGLYGQGL